MDIIKKAIKLLSEGKPVFIHDESSREDEVDMVFYAPKVSWRSISMLRSIAGGLICYVMPREVGIRIGLRYMDEILSSAGYGNLSSKRLSYGDPPNFSLWVNHYTVKTGIRDEDRAKTVRELDKVVELVLKGKVDEAKRKFYGEFIAPGHVPILLGRSLKERKGHTELSMTLAILGGLRPSLVIAEVLDEGGAMSVSKVREIAYKLNSIVIEGNTIISEWAKSQRELKI